MFRKMRRSKKEVFEKDIEDILNEGEYGVLSLTGENGYPYGVPVNYAYHNNSIYFHCAGEGQKLDIIKRHEKVSFCTVSETELVPEKFTTKYKSVIAFGTAAIIIGEEKMVALGKLIEKYSPGFEEMGKRYISAEEGDTTVIKISVDHITGKSGY